MKQGMYIIGRRLFVAATFFLALGAVAQTTKPELKTPIRALLPLSLQNLSLVHPTVEARIQIDEEGKVTDVVVVEAAHWGLIERTRNLLLEARFEPARENGKPVAVRIPMKILFAHPAEVGLGNRSAMDAVEATVNNTGRSARYKMEVSTADKLDQPLKVIRQGERFVPETEDGKPIAGEAMVIFYVDDEGKVRLPTVKSSTDPLVSQAALMTLQGMQFAPPTVNQNPTVVRVAMPFNYTVSADQAGDGGS